MPKKDHKSDINTEWMITHCSRHDQGTYLCDICGVTLTLREHWSDT